MAARTGTQAVPTETKRIRSFEGGMNTSVGGRYIADEEAVRIKNFEFDDANDLITRNGFFAVASAESAQVSSVFVFNTESAFIGILHTFSNSLHSLDGPPLGLGETDTNLSAGLPGGIPNNTRWYWKQLNNTAVAVNGGPTVQVNGGAPGTASALAAAPNGKYIEEWNKRLWIVHASLPNRIQCSDLGSATAWNTGGLTNPVQGIIIDVAAGDGDKISGLYATKERLFIFKRTKIYILRIIANPETDPNNWELVEYSKVIGCTSASTIREVFNDVVFLSEGGLCSLNASEKAVDFESALVSQKMSDIQRISKDVNEIDIFGFALPDRSQYWLSVGQPASPTGEAITYVMDYKEIRRGFLRWTVYDRLVPTAMDIYKVGQAQNVYVFGNESDDRMASHIPNVLAQNRVYSDITDDAITPTSVGIDKLIITKSYDFDLENLRKELVRWFITIGIEPFPTTMDNFTVNYAWDDEATQANFKFDGLVITATKKEKFIQRAPRHGSQRKGVFITFKILHNDDEEGLSIKNFGMEYSVLSDNRAENLGVSATVT